MSKHLFIGDGTNGKIYDVEGLTFNEVSSFTETRDIVAAVFTLDKTRLFYSFTDTGEIRVRDFNDSDGTLGESTLVANTASADDLRISEDDSTLLVNERTSGISIFDAVSFDLISSSNNEVFDADINSDGSRIVLLFDDGDIRVVDRNLNVIAGPVVATGFGGLDPGQNKCRFINDSRITTDNILWSFENDQIEQIEKHDALSGNLPFAISDPLIFDNNGSIHELKNDSIIDVDSISGAPAGTRMAGQDAFENLSVISSNAGVSNSALLWGLEGSTAVSYETISVVERQAAVAFVKEPRSVGPTTPEQIFRATYANASAVPPKETALLQRAPARRLANHIADVYSYPPYRVTKRLPVNLQDYELTLPGMMMWHQDSADPLFSMGRWAQIEERRFEDDPRFITFVMRISDHPESFVPPQ